MNNDHKLNQQMHEETHDTYNSGLLMTIGLITVVAFVVVWFVFGGSGDDLASDMATTTDELVETSAQNSQNVESEIRSEVSTVATSTELEMARFQARAELMATQAELEAEQNYEEALTEVEAIEADLAEAYVNASAEAQTEWQDIKAEFDTFEESLRSGTADALEMVAGLILLLESDIRTDEDE